MTRDVYPNSPNPYVPWNPLGAALGPLALVSLFYTRKKKRSKTGTFLVLLVVLGGVGMTLAACAPAPAPSPLPTVPPASDTPIPSATYTPSPTAPPSPTPTPTYSCPQIFPPGQGGIAYITIDDGPGSYTGAVLDVLAKYQVKATFFLVGKNIQQYPGEVQRMKNEGHAIGIHSWDHPYWGDLSTDAQSKQNQDTQQALYSAIGEYSNLFRAPGGATTTSDVSNLYNYNWTHNSFDYCYDAGNAQTVANNVFQGVSQAVCPDEAGQETYTQGIAIDNSRPSQPIILIHSIHAVDPPALEIIILGLQSRGYGFGILPRPCDVPGTTTPIATFN